MRGGRAVRGWRRRPCGSCDGGCAVCCLVPTCCGVLCGAPRTPVPGPCFGTTHTRLHTRLYTHTHTHTHTHTPRTQDAGHGAAVWCGAHRPGLDPLHHVKGPRDRADLSAQHLVCQRAGRRHVPRGRARRCGAVGGAARTRTPRARTLAHARARAYVPIVCVCTAAALAGNLLVLPDGRVGFLDFGIVGRIRWGRRGVSCGLWRRRAPSA
jgi:hypothetical protein